MTLTIDQEALNAEEAGKLMLRIMTLTIDQEALMLRILDAEEAGKRYHLSREDGLRDYITVKNLETLELVTVSKGVVQSTCEGYWLHDSLRIRVRLRDCGEPTRACPLPTI